MFRQRPQGTETGQPSRRGSSLVFSIICLIVLAGFVTVAVDTGGLALRDSVARTWTGLVTVDTGQQKAVAQWCSQRDARGQDDANEHATALFRLPSGEGRTEEITAQTISESKKDEAVEIETTEADTLSNDDAYLVRMVEISQKP